MVLVVFCCVVVFFVGVDVLCLYFGVTAVVVGGAGFVVLGRGTVAVALKALTFLLFDEVASRWNEHLYSSRMPVSHGRNFSLALATEFRPGSPELSQSVSCRSRGGAQLCIVMPPQDGLLRKFPCTKDMLLVSPQKSYVTKRDHSKFPNHGRKSGAWVRVL